MKRKRKPKRYIWFVEYQLNPPLPVTKRERFNDEVEANIRAREVGGLVIRQRYTKL